MTSSPTLNPFTSLPRLSIVPENSTPRISVAPAGRGYCPLLCLHRSYLYLLGERVGRERTYMRSIRLIPNAKTCIMMSSNGMEYSSKERHMTHFNQNLFGVRDRLWSLADVQIVRRLAFVLHKYSTHRFSWHVVQLESGLWVIIAE